MDYRLHQVLFRHSSAVAPLVTLSGITATSSAGDTTPDFNINFPFEEGDLISAEVSPTGAGTYSAYFTDREVTAGEAAAEALAIAGITPLTDGTYDFRFRYERDSVVSDWSGLVQFTVNTAPTISGAFSPADNATDIALTASLVATFNKNIQFGTGTIRLYDSDDDLIESFNVATEVGTGNGQVSIAGAVLTINPTASMEGGKVHYVQIDSTAIENLNDVAFAGIADETTWNFTTTAAVTNLVLNPNFDSDTVWTKGGGAVITGGVAQLRNTFDGVLQTGITFASGTNYHVRVDFVNGAGSGPVPIRVAHYPSEAELEEMTPAYDPSSNGATFTAEFDYDISHTTASDYSIQIYSGGGNPDADVTFVSITAI